MPFGVKNAPGSFQREMRRVLHDKLNKGVFVFIDDIIVYSRTEDEHLELIDWVLGRLEAEGYYANPAKCEFLRSQVSFLGHMVSREGLSMQQHKIAAVHNWPVPQSVKDVRAFLGLAGFYRRFVRNFASLAQPLTDLTKIADRRWWSWGPEEQRAFDTLKQALTSAPVLAHPDPAAAVDGADGRVRIRTGRSAEPAAGRRNDAAGRALEPQAQQRRTQLQCE